MNRNIVITASPELFDTYLSLTAEPPISYPRHEREVVIKTVGTADADIAGDTGKRLAE